MINRDLQKVILQTIIQEIMKAQHLVELLQRNFLSEIPFVFAVFSYMS